MIGSLRGLVVAKSPGQALLDVQGVGYELCVPISAFDRLPDIGREAILFVSESMAMYGGGVTLYGFLSREDKEIYMLLREIPGTGAKKALDYLDKISKSAPDFRRAVLEGDTRRLVSLFGFTKKTADKIIAALKDRMTELRLSGKEKFVGAVMPAGWGEAREALVSLGYREKEARIALEQLPAATRQSGAIPDLVKEALRHLS